jgi:hypothetical protein
MDCPGSDKRYGFTLALSPSKRLYIYESAIDSMSHASMEILASGNKDIWKNNSRLALAGTSDAALSFFLNKQTTISELVFCLDNDPSGHEATANLTKKYDSRGLRTRVELPKGKDYSEDLMNSLQKALLERTRKQLNIGER